MLSLLHSAALCAAVVATPPAPAPGNEDALRLLPFREVPGEFEFTGQLIVHPRSAADFEGCGTAEATAGELAAAGLRMLEGLAYRQLHPGLPELVVSVPSGSSENELARELLASGLFAHVSPNWRLFGGQAVDGGTGPDDNVPDDEVYCFGGPCGPGQWNLDMIEAERAWRIHRGQTRMCGTTDCGAQSSMILGVVDSGVAIDDGIMPVSPDLVAGRLPGYNVGHELEEASWPGTPCIDSSALTDDYDVDAHGTRVLGVMASQTDNAEDVAGINWDIAYMPVRIRCLPPGVDTCNSEPDCTYPDPSIANMLEGVAWASDNGARVITTTSAIHESTLMTMECCGAYVRNNMPDATKPNAVQGLLFWAAGNTNCYETWGDLEDPCPSVTIVGGSNQGDRRWGIDQDCLIPYTSNSGPGSKWGGHVDIFAPSVNIHSTKRYDAGPPATFGCGTGTSYATPHAAGAAALVWSINPDLTPDEVEDLLIATGDPIDLDNGQPPAVGQRLNLGAAAEAAAIRLDGPASAQAGGPLTLDISEARPNETYYLAYVVEPQGAAATIDFTWHAGIDAWTSIKEPYYLWPFPLVTDANGEDSILIPSLPQIPSSTLVFQVLQEGAPWGRPSNLLEVDLQ